MNYKVQVIWGVERTNTHEVWVTIRKEPKSRNAVSGKSKTAIRE